MTFNSFFQELQLIYQGLKIDDVTFDICNDLLILIDSGILSQTKIVSSTVETKLKFEKWTKNEVEKEAELISSHSNTLVYTSKNSQIWHSDGFVLKSRDGSIICSSDPDQSYNLRAIQVFEKSVYLLDAHNLVLWKLDLKDATVSTVKYRVSHMDTQCTMCNFHNSTDTLKF